MRRQSIEDFGDDEPEIEDHANRKGGIAARRFMRMLRVIMIVYHRSVKL